MIICPDLGRDQRHALARLAVTRATARFLDVVPGFIPSFASHHLGKTAWFNSGTWAGKKLHSEGRFFNSMGTWNIKPREDLIKEQLSLNHAHLTVFAICPVTQYSWECHSVPPGLGTVVSQVTGPMTGWISQDTRVAFKIFPAVLCLHNLVYTLYINVHVLIYS